MDEEALHSLLLQAHTRMDEVDIDSVDGAGTCTLDEEAAEDTCQQRLLPPLQHSLDSPLLQPCETEEGDVVAIQNDELEDASCEDGDSEEEDKERLQADQREYCCC
jgi:hypothetical protein